MGWKVGAGIRGFSSRKRYIESDERNQCGHVKSSRSRSSLIAAPSYLIAIRQCGSTKTTAYTNSSIAFPFRTIITGRPLGVWYSLVMSMPRVL
jgi:hypothetical protein